MPYPHAGRGPGRRPGLAAAPVHRRPAQADGRDPRHRDPDHRPSAGLAGRGGRHRRRRLLRPPRRGAPGVAGRGRTAAARHHRRRDGAARPRRRPQVRRRARCPRPDEPWYATNGDIWTRFSLREMAAFHAERDAVATLALARPRIPWGAVETDEFGHILDFIESPPSPYLINAGVYVFSAGVRRRCCRTAATTSARRSRGWPASAGWPASRSRRAPTGGPSTPRRTSPRPRRSWPRWRPAEPASTARAGSRRTEVRRCRRRPGRCRGPPHASCGPPRLQPRQAADRRLPAAARTCRRRRRSRRAAAAAGASRRRWPPPPVPVRSRRRSGRALVAGGCWAGGGLLRRAPGRCPGVWLGWPAAGGLAGLAAGGRSPGVVAARGRAWRSWRLASGAACDGRRGVVRAPVPPAGLLRERGAGQVVASGRRRARAR